MEWNWSWSCRDKPSRIIVGHECKRLFATTNVNAFQAYRRETKIHAAKQLPFMLYNYVSFVW